MKKIIIVGLLLISALTFLQEDDSWLETDKSSNGNGNSGNNGNYGNPHNQDDNDHPVTPIVNYLTLLALTGVIYSLKKLK